MIAAKVNWKDRSYAAGVHLCISLAVALAASLLVFVIWYPYPYREISGGRELFLLLVVVDVILGPLITFCVFDRAKPRSELARDLAFVGLVQAAALAYGLWTMFLARPVQLVFEIDRFRVVHAVDIPAQTRSGGLPPLPLTGPGLAAVRPFRNSEEGFNATMQALQGMPIAARRDLWQPYELARGRVLQAAKPVSELKARFPVRGPEIDELLQKSGYTSDNSAYVPMVGRNQFWTVLVDPASAALLGFLPLDPY